MKSSPLRVYILGAGNVGLGLALALRRAGVPVVGLWNRDARRRRRARRTWGAVIDGPELGPTLAEANLVLVCVRAEAIAEVGRVLHGSDLVARGAVVAHCSGAHPSTHLGRQRAAWRGSIHPLVACPTPEAAAQALPGSTFAIEGQREALQRLRQVARALGGSVIQVSARAKSRYHAAAVLASNLVTSLVAMAAREARACGVPDAERRLCHLARGALAATQDMGSTRALTGPLVRGDLATLEQHLGALPKSTRRIYALLSGEALKYLTVGKLSRTQRARIGQLLGNNAN